MEDMLTHQCTKNELNQFVNSAKFGTNAHTRSPPSQTIFNTFTFKYLSVYIALHKGK